MTDARPHLGACHCGAVTFAVVAPRAAVVGCHCSQCRKTSGHYWAASSVPHDRFRLTRAEGLRWYRSSALAQRGFCGNCGASLFWQPTGQARIAFAAGALGDTSGLTLAEHIFTDDAGDYYAPEGPPPAPGPAPAILACSCLCGGVAFTLPGPSGDITACHCSQCRRLSGHFAASFDADEARLVYIARATLGEYQTPGGGRRGFCTACGSSLWFRAADGEFSVEGGAVDGPTGGRLTAHIFAADKGDYYPIDDGLPQS